MSGLTVDRGLVVAFHFSLTDQDGELIDDSSGRPPLSYLHGHGGVVPGLAEAMEGRCEGEHFQVAVPPEKAYGAQGGGPPQPMPREAFPPELLIVPGMQFDAMDQSGHPLLLWVIDVQGDEVFVSDHHPLAGKTLHFDIEIVEIRTATPQELEKGQPDMPGMEFEALADQAMSFMGETVDE